MSLGPQPDEGMGARSCPRPGTLRVLPCVGNETSSGPRREHVMTPSRRFPSRLAMTLLALVALLVLGAASALGQSAPSTDASSPTGGGRLGTGGPGVSSSGALTEESGTISPASAVRSIASPVAWCCTSGSVPGLTVMGQATIKDRGEVARDAAIAEAVADATDQAKTAADAAGIQLGAVLDLEISAMPIVYPMDGIAPPDAGIAAGSAGGVTEGGSGPGTTGPAVPPDQYLGAATVTITWAIG